MKKIYGIKQLCISFIITLLFVFMVYPIYFDIHSIESGYENNTALLSVDWMLLFSVVILAFLLSYKLVLYVDKFKIVEKNSRIDIVFIAVFIVLLFVPMSYISNADKSLQENRTLAEYPTFIRNNNFGKEFNSWFNDRFFGRENVIKFNTNILYNLNSIYQNTKAIFFKKTGWMFGKPIVQHPPLERKIQETIDTIRKFNGFCQENNIQVYILIVPKKEHIYSHLFNNYGYDTATEQKFNNYIKRIQNSLPDNRIIYPYNELKNALNDDYVFFKQTHHWTDYGAFVGYKKLASKIMEDFPNFRMVSLDEYEKSYSKNIRDDWKRNYKKVGHTVNLLNLNDKDEEEILNTEYTYYDYKKEADITSEIGKYTKEFHNNSANNKYRLFMTGNSQNEDLLQFMVASVQDTKYLRLNVDGNLPKKEQFKFMKHYERELLNFKPNMIVITISDSALTSVSDFFKE